MLSVWLIITALVMIGIVLFKRAVDKAPDLPPNKSLM